MYNTRSYKVSKNYIRFYDEIKNIERSVENAYRSLNIDLSELDNKYKRVNQESSNEEDVLIYLQDYHEPKRYEIYERLNSELSGILKNLYTIFESTLTCILSNKNIRRARREEASYQPYLEYVENNLNINLSDDFYETINNFRVMRNRFTHEGIDLTTSDDEVKEMIHSMSSEIFFFIDAVMSSLSRNN